MPALTITGNTNDALAAIAKLERQYDALENKVRRLKKTSEEGDGGFGKMVQGAVQFGQTLTGVASGVDLVMKGIQLASAEWDDFVARQNKAKDANVVMAQSLTKLSLATDMPLEEVKGLVDRLSQQHNVKVQDIPEMINRFQASKGPTQGMEVVERTFGAAAKLGKFDPESMAQLGETALDITKQMPGSTPEQALGFSLAAQAQSRVADPAQFNKNVIPAVLGGNKISGTPLEYGVAISNALTHGSGDTTGKRSNTAQIGLEMQLGEMLPEYKSTMERIEAIRNDPALKDAIIHGKSYQGRNFKGIQTEFIGPDGQTINMDTGRLSGERRMMPAIEALLTKGSAEENIMNKTLQNLPKLADAAEEFHRRAEANRNDPTMQLAERAQQGENAAQAARLRDKKGALESIVRKNFDEQMSAEGVGLFYRQDAGWGKWGRERLLGQSPDEAAYNTSKAWADEMRSRAAASNIPALRDQYEQGAKAFENTAAQHALPALEAQASGLTRTINDSRGDPEAQKVAREQLDALHRLIEATKAGQRRPVNRNGNVEPN